MNQVNCPICGKKCVKSGKTKAGSWFVKTSSTHKINNESKELQFFLNWLFGKRISSNDAWRRKNLSKKDSKVLEYMGYAAKGRRNQSLCNWF